MLKLIDSHVHLDLPAFDADREAVMHRARQAGVECLVVPATSRASWAPIDALCRSSPDLFPAYGLHPVFSPEHAPPDVEVLSSWLRLHPAVAIGEIGLDFHEDRTTHDAQRDYFRRQLRLAQEHALPVIVHARQAFEEVTLTLRQAGGLHGVVHSFSGSAQQAEQLWRIGFHLGIGGPVTYPRAKRLRHIVASMPMEFLLLESDAPDQPDSEHRGQRNEPARLGAILRCVAELRGQSPEQVASATSANARRLFHLDSYASSKRV